MSTTIERHTTDSHALRRLLGALMADCRRSCSAASAGDRDSLQARETFALVTELLALVTAAEDLSAWLRAVGNRVLAGLANIIRNFRKGRLATWTM
jgi:hypothetical protein